MLPKIKKRVSDFLKSEKGGVSKKSLVDSAITVGLIFVLSQAVNAGHGNQVQVSYSPSGDGTVTGVHTNHSSHSSY